MPRKIGTPLALPIRARRCSIKLKRDGQRHPHANCFPLIKSWNEVRLFDYLNGSLIARIMETANDADLTGMTLLVDNELDKHASFSSSG